MARKLNGFTLVELLVVISIIMLLAGLLLPILGRAREESRRTSCNNRLAQLGKAMMGYMGENGDYWPYQYDARPTDHSVMGGDGSGRVNGHPKYAAPNNRYFNASVSLSLCYPKWIDNIDVFQCPSSDDQPLIARGISNGHLYSWFGKLAGKEHTPGGTLSASSPNNGHYNNGTSFGYDDLAGRRDMLPASARVADMRWTGPMGGTWSNHGDDGQNVLYWDGHVAFSDSAYASVDTQDNIYATVSTTLAELRQQCDADTVILRTHNDAY